jgi:hypothetical protein
MKRRKCSTHRIGKLQRNRRSRWPKPASTIPYRAKYEVKNCGCCRSYRYELNRAFTNSNQTSHINNSLALNLCPFVSLNITLCITMDRKRICSQSPFLLLFLTLTTLLISLQSTTAHPQQNPPSNISPAPPLLPSPSPQPPLAIPTSASTLTPTNTPLPQQEPPKKKGIHLPTGAWIGIGVGVCAMLSCIIAWQKRGLPSHVPHAAMQMNNGIAWNNSHRQN